MPDVAYSCDDGLRLYMTDGTGAASAYDHTALPIPLAISSPAWMDHA